MKYKYWGRFQGTKLIFQGNPMSNKVKNWMGTFANEFLIKFVRFNNLTPRFHGVSKLISFLVAFVRFLTRYGLERRERKCEKYDLFE